MSNKNKIILPIKSTLSQQKFNPVSRQFYMIKNFGFDKNIKIQKQ